MTSNRHQQGSALILALSVISLLVALGTAGIIFARHERIESSAFLSVNNTTHALNAGIEEGLSLAHAFSDPRRQLCEHNGGNPSSPTCNATKEITRNINGEDFTIEVDFRPYNYPSAATFIVRTPMPDYQQQATVQLDTNLNILETITTTH